ncbi:MAG: hypothetical protein IT264_11815 [Saprospiraceae bacterium]|nr:hypothetical protein [Saprospiraceae bacterium]
MESKKIRELNNDEVIIFLRLMITSNVDELFKKLELTSGGWVLKAIQKRFVAHKLNVDKKVMIAVLAIGDGIVGKCAFYVDDIASWGSKFNRKEIDWNTFTKEIYPLGIPVN